MARTAWHAGSVETSLRFLDLSLQFYPHHKDAHNLRERILSGDYQNSVDHETLPPQDEPSPQPALEKPSAAQPQKNQLELIDTHYLRERVLSEDSRETLPPQGAPSPPRAFENWSAAPLLRNQLEFGSLLSYTRTVATERIYRDWVKSEPLFEGPPRPPIQELP